MRSNVGAGRATTTALLIAMLQVAAIRLSLLPEIAPR
jgi:hypothetical protein